MKSFFIKIYSPTGPLNRDYDDVRSIMNASSKGLKKAIAVGAKKPLILNTISKEMFKYSNSCALLGALEASYNVRRNIYFQFK